MRKALSCLAIGLSAMAPAAGQIKMADNAYKEELTAGTSVTEPLAIDNVLAAYDGTYLEDFYLTNIVGDTLYTNGIHAKCFVANHTARTIEYKTGDTNEGTSIPQGYYRVTDLLLGKEGQTDATEEIASLVGDGYDITAFIKKYAWFCDECKVSPEHCKEHIAERIPCGSKTNEELNRTLQQYQSRNETCDLRELGDWCYRLEAADGSAVYYAGSTAFGNSSHWNFFPLRYYNFLCSELKGQDVYMPYDNPKSSGVYCAPYRQAVELHDALTGKTLLQRDTLFRCVDMVLNEVPYTGLVPFCVLEGEHTGKVSLAVYHLVETDRQDYRLYYHNTPSGELSIWKSSPKQKDDGQLLRDRHFATSKNGDHQGQWLIKASDLQEIVADTKRHNANAAEQEEALRQRQRALQAQRKQDLCSRYGKEFGELITAHKVALGMTPEMCREAWGIPSKISNMVDATGTYTMWRYNLNTYVYFLDGKVVRIQN